MSPAPTELTPPPPPPAPGSNRRLTRAVLILSGVVVLAAGVFFIIMYTETPQPQDNRGATLSQAGAVDYVDIKATAGPSLELQAMPRSAQLPGDRADEFDVSDDGLVLLRVKKVLFDFAEGEQLTRTQDSVSSFAFVAGAVAIVTGERHLAYLNEEGVKDVGPAPIGASRVRPSDDGQELFLIRDEEPYSLASLDLQGQVHPLSGSPGRIEAVAGTSARHIFSVGKELYLQEEAGPPALLLRLPEDGQTILGVALHGDDIYFATRQGVYAIQGSLAVPLLLGVGGPLRVTKDGLVILNADNGRLYQLVAR